MYSSRLTELGCSSRYPQNSTVRDKKSIGSVTAVPTHICVWAHLKEEEPSNTVTLHFFKLLFLEFLLLDVSYNV